MAKKEHFEIPVDDIARAQTFYREALEFDYQPWGDEMGMLAQPDGKGINGDLHLRGAAPHPTVVFTVASIEATLEKVLALGGTQVGQIGYLDEAQTQRWVYVTDSEGNVIGLYDEVDAN